MSANPSPDPPREPGRLLDGKYRLIRPLGEGGVGLVYVAEHTFLKKHFALKLLRPEMVAYPEVSARFETEARAASQIEHDNVVRVSDFGRTPEGELYLVMELLNGRALSDEMAAMPKLAPQRALWITSEVLKGLEAAHAHGVVHRDLKPENVFIVARLDGSEGVKLLDFGIAKLDRQSSTRLTQTGAIIGTPQYMAPEQARGLPIDLRVDLHAAGVMLYEMLSGYPPYQGDNYNTVLFEIMSGRPPHLHRYAPEIDESLASLAMRAFHPDRDQRFPSAKAMRERIDAYRAGQAPPGPRLPAATAAPVIAHDGPLPGELALHDVGAELQVAAVDVSLDEQALAEAAALAAQPRVAPRLDALPPGADPTPPSTVEGPLDRSPPSVGAPAPVAPPAPNPILATGLPSTPRPPTPPLPPPPSGRSRELTPPHPGADGPALQIEGREGQATSLVDRPRRPPASRSGERPSAADPWGPGLGRLVLLLLLLVAALGIWRWKPWVDRHPRPQNVWITVEGTPEHAVVTYDGVRRFLSPFDVPFDERAHELRIECPGFRPKVVSIVPGQDHRVDGRLKAAP